MELCFFVVMTLYRAINHFISQVHADRVPALNMTPIRFYGMVHESQRATGGRWIQVNVVLNVLIMSFQFLWWIIESTCVLGHLAIYVNIVCIGMRTAELLHLCNTVTFIRPKFIERWMMAGQVKSYRPRHNIFRHDADALCFATSLHRFEWHAQVLWFRRAACVQFLRSQL